MKPPNSYHPQSQLGDLSPAATVAIGIIVGLLSTSIQSIGLTLQRKSHQLEDEKEDELIRRPPYRRRRWQLGMSMFVLSNLVGSSVQITTLPLPVLSTLQASGLVFNTICASIVLHEPFTRWSFIGTSLIAAGAALIALFGAVAEPSHNLTQHLEFLSRPQFLLWMAATFLLLALILTAIFFINRLQSISQRPIFRLARGFAFGAISSILSAHALLIAKSAVELIVRTVVDRKNQFDRWESWCILLLLVFFALSQLYFLHRGLKLVSTSLLYPFVFCVYNIIAILDGLIYFRQASRLTALHAGLIALGTCVLLSGVFALSWRLDDQRYTAPPPDPHTFLTPGMGLVEDVATEDEDENEIDPDSPIFSTDDRIQAPTSPASERTPLLRQSRLRPNLRMSMPANLHQLSHQSKQRSIHDHSGQFPPTLLRRQYTEAADIWDELQDSQPMPLSPLSRKGTLVRTQSPVSYFPRRASTIGPGRRNLCAHFEEDVDQAASPSEIEHQGSKILSSSTAETRANGKGQEDLESGSPRKRSRTMAAGPASATEIRYIGSRRRENPASIWREQDRERRRHRGWSSAGLGDVVRSVSTPLSAGASSWLDRRRTSLRGMPADTELDASSHQEPDAQATSATGTRNSSLGGWLLSFLPGRTQPADTQADSPATPSDPPPPPIDDRPASS